MDFFNYSTWFTPDLILILISTAACAYCALLSHRLKKLNDLKSGVGASILSLTDAIGRTHEAAKDAQASTLQTVDTLRHLLKQCESAAPNIEAKITELTTIMAKAKNQKQEIDDSIENKVMPTIQRASDVTRRLLQAIEISAAYHKVKSREEQSLGVIVPAEIVRPIKTISSNNNTEYPKAKSADQINSVQLNENSEDSKTSDRAYA